ncbi:MAG: tRNA (adenosine(37)-N6)-threonylcarbamoyltransferase complex ATPase subunit type 1 TsaE [Prevotellaceae bacterium]|jgi:tRNA threonylcarbamoyladenosine biosynthesis protein TsaE|nr:tRNA (adenosine(37)-N6)-threonylcarbamoyltransferase complex ATPase subunit type 1 TsaE [Prevotellaceae bacterium]
MQTIFPLTIDTLTALPQAAQQLLPLLEQHKVIAFYGAMGAGKTTLIKAICDAMGITGTVNSPTFALVNEYRKPGGEPLYHFDFYRINKPEEAFDLGYEEYFFSGHACLVEWPELIAPLLPANALHLHINVDDNGTRTLNISPVNGK